MPQSTANFGYIYRFKAFDFSIDYYYRPNDDIYQEIVPTELKLSAVVPSNFPDLTVAEQTKFLEDVVIEALADQVTFDTDDDPDFAIESVDFCFETDLGDD